MRKPLPQARFFLLCAVCTAMFATGCATTPAIDEVGTRAQARWDHLLAGELETAYGFLSPGTRSSVSSLQYQRSIYLKKVRWTKARHVESDCQEDTCKVSILLDYSLLAPLPGVAKYESSKTVTENWVRVDGQWWFVPKS